MQSRWIVLVPIVALATGTVPAADQTFVETFDSGSANEGGWTFGGPSGSFPGSGGNPGAYLASGLLDTFAPMPRTTLVGSLFTGDFRKRGVSSIGLDLNTFQAGSTGGRPLTLMLIHDNQTPGNPNDDTAAYFLGPNIPGTGQGWVSYDFFVPSAETELPAGWLLLNMGNIDDPANHTWDEVIRDVDQVRYFYGDPTFFFIFQQWFLGLDNARITEAACEALAGAVPDGDEVPGTMLTIQKTPGTNLRLFWGVSCQGCDTDYGVYEGSLGNYYDHSLNSCSSAGVAAKVVIPAAGSTYYLVVPSNGLNEGSYGRDSEGAERPPGGAVCFPQAFDPCS